MPSLTSLFLVLKIFSEQFGVSIVWSRDGLFYFNRVFKECCTEIWCSQKLKFSFLARCKFFFTILFQILHSEINFEAVRR